MTAPVAALPYALAPTPFAFPALAALTARAPLGGARESAISCYLAARLAAALAASRLAPELLRERADAARSWLGAQSVDPARRAAVSAVVNATAAAEPAAAAAELDRLRSVLEDVLDAPAAAELRRLAARLRAMPHYL